MNRSYQKELLDGKNIPFADIRQNMHELNIINSWLGGHTITIRGFKKLLGNSTAISVCEIGCGGGDNLLAIYNWCRQHGIHIRLTGIDHNPDCLAVAAARLPAAKARFIAADYRKAVFEDGSPDIIFSSLFCHHFTDEELVPMLRWMQYHSGKGFFINDLHRHFLALYSIQLLTSLFSKSYLVKNDAPLSVKRGFIKKEWTGLMKKAGIDAYTLSWEWAFRWLITCTKP